MNNPSHFSSLCIYASGKGSNAQAIINYFSGNNKIKVALIVTNNPKAGVIDIAKKEQIPYIVINREDFTNNRYLQRLKEHGIDWIILAGFLWKIPAGLIKEYPGRIINIHPALLPSYGGKGMYGMHVHEAVINNGEPKSGITIHYVNEKYDDGKIIFQKEVVITPDDTPDSLAEKIHHLEHENFARVIEGEVMG